MVVETFRTSGSEACALTVQDNVNGVAVEWSFQLECPARLVLAFLNEDYESFTKEDPPTDEQAWYLRGAFAKGNGALLREMVDHVLVCREERGFDPITRLAAYSFAHELFDLSRVASYAERVSLEASVVGTKAMASMTAGWSGILSAHKAQPLAQRSDLFEALVLDAAEKGYAFELSLSQEHSSLSQLLKSFVVEMIRTRVLLGRCPGCGQYFLAAEGSDCNCANKSADLPPVNPGKGDAAGKLYRQIYQAMAAQARRGQDLKAREALDRFAIEAREWRTKIKLAKASQNDFLEWLESQKPE